MSGIPDSWILSDYHSGDGVTAQISLPAVVGVSHVIDGIEATLISNPAGPAYAPSIAISAGGTGRVVGYLSVPGPITIDRVSIDGPWSYPPNTAIVVSFSAAASGEIAEILKVRGHAV